VCLVRVQECESVVAGGSACVINLASVNDVRESACASAQLGAMEFKDWKVGMSSHLIIRSSRQKMCNSGQQEVDVDVWSNQIEMKLIHN